MEKVQLLAFPVHRVPKPYLYRSINGFENTIKRCPLNWSLKNSQQLSETLNCQIEHNHIDLEQLWNQCKKEPLDQELILRLTDYIDGNSVEIDRYRFSPWYRAKKCIRLMDMYGKYENHRILFDKDTKVFNQVNWNVKTYAVIMLYEGQYLGHVYVWQSPLDPSICIAMGVRCRISSQFTKGELESISRYLFCGVEKLCLYLGCKSISVVHPYLIMISILEKIGFIPSQIDTKLLGVSLEHDDGKNHSNLLGKCTCFDRRIDDDSHYPIKFALVI